MNVLGIHDGHNASACLLMDGRIRMAVQEERLRRVKNWAGFPEQSIRFILRECVLTLDDIDRFALVGHDMPDQNSKDERLAMYRRVGQAGYLDRLERERRRRRILNRLTLPELRRFLGQMSGQSDNGRRPSGRLAGVLSLGVPPERIEVVEHHAAHAAAAYYGRGIFDREILVLTNDGEGDGLCATVNVGRGGNLRRLGSVPRSESIGNLYAVTTFLLGMVPLEHEYKLMGLAPYADERAASAVYRKFRSLFEFDESAPFAWRRSKGCPDLFYSYSFVRDLVERDRFDAICGGLQRATEDLLLEWVRRCVRATGIRTLALSGGVFMNVKLNKAIMELPEVDDLFVFPSCADETNAIGSAYFVAAQNGSAAGIEPLRDLYFGKSYDNEAVMTALERCRFDRPVRWDRHDDIEAEVARLLARGEIVARFRGREEFGARALGNRSILADPSNTDAIKVINAMIKCRDFWMPFATSMTDHQAERCLVNPKRIPAPYMILTFDTTERIRDFKAGAHPYDLTVRPQVVYREWNPTYYRVIEEFEKLSGKRGGVLNTSFNLHGHPLVSSPADALDVFGRSGLKHLAIEDYLLHKED